MNSMFWGAHSFNQPLHSWDVSSVTDMEYMFNRSYSFNQPLHAWDTSNANMPLMFQNAYKFNQPIQQLHYARNSTIYQHTLSSFVLMEFVGAFMELSESRDGLTKEEKMDLGLMMDCGNMLLEIFLFSYDCLLP